MANVWHIPVVLSLSGCLSIFCMAIMVVSNKIVPESIKPSIQFEDLELKCLCDRQELFKQFPLKIRTKWTKCLGLGRVYFNKSAMVASQRESDTSGTLNEKTWKRLRLFLTTNDESLNVYCRLASNWKPCAYHLRNVHCLQSNPDAIQLAKNPKYSPLHHKRYSLKTVQNKANQLVEREDNVENMHELYQIRCEHVRMSAHYLHGGDSRTTADGSNWLNQFNQHLFQDYQYPVEHDYDQEIFREEL